MILNTNSPPITNRMLASSNNVDLSQKYNEAIHAAGHDMRSPLTVIKSYVQLIKLISDEDKKLELLEQMHEASLRLEGVISGLVELADVYHIGNKNAELLSFENLFRESLEKLKYEFHLNEVTIKTNFKTCPDIVYISSFLKKLFYQLLRNAFQYTAQNPFPVIDISTRFDGDFIVLEIKDNGIGIDLERGKKDLFKPFKRLTTESKGRGLGLTFSKAIVEKNGGKIYVDSNPDSGTVVNIQFVPYKMEGIIHKTNPLK